MTGQGWNWANKEYCSNVHLPPRIPLTLGLILFLKVIEPVTPPSKSLIIFTLGPKFSQILYRRLQNK